MLIYSLLLSKEVTSKSFNNRKILFIPLKFTRNGKYKKMDLQWLLTHVCLYSNNHLNNTAI